MRTTVPSLAAFLAAALILSAASHATAQSSTGGKKSKAATDGKKLKAAPNAAPAAAATNVEKAAETYQKAVEAYRTGKKIVNALSHAWLEIGPSFPKVPLRDGKYTIPLYKRDSRVSDNFDNFDRDRRVRVRFENVPDEDLKQVQATVRADKVLRDQSRSDPFGHNQTITIRKKSQDAERGNFIGRLKFPGGEAEFFKRNPYALLIIEPLD